VTLREDHPIYLNPSDKELITLAESGWDSLRVMENDETLIIGSGYGNTHETLVQFYKKYAGGGKTKERWDPRGQRMEKVFVCPAWRLPSFDPLILFYDARKILLCNLTDVGGSEFALPREWKKVISNERIRQFTLIAECSGLTLA
jgi:hypothetical protein